MMTKFEASMTLVKNIRTGEENSLQEVLTWKEILNKAIERRKLIAFADDIMLMADSKEETETFIVAQESLAQDCPKTCTVNGGCECKSDQINEIPGP